MDSDVFQLIGSYISSVSASAILWNILSHYIDFMISYCWDKRCKMNICWGYAYVHLASIILSLWKDFFWESWYKFFVSIRLPVSSDDVMSFYIPPVSFSTFWKSAQLHASSSSCLCLFRKSITSCFWNS